MRAIDKKKIKNLWDVILFIKDCKEIHAKWEEHYRHKKGYKNFDNAEFHQACVKRYGEIIKVLMKVCGDLF